MALNPCPCCGYLTLEKPPPETDQICPVCFWEDAMTFYEGGTNNVSLLEAQRNFVQMGACEEYWRDWVRLPSKSEQRPANWKTLDENFDVFQQKVIQSIQKAFDRVELEDGITLVEARLIDDYIFDYSQKKQLKEERFKQQIEHNHLFRESLDITENDLLENWQDIPERVIKNLSDVLCFLDEKGYRFYLPAYMIWTINYFGKWDYYSVDSTIFSLCPSEYNLSRRQLLTVKQCQAICQFVRFMAIYDNDFMAGNLETFEYWQQFCQPLGNEVYYRYGFCLKNRKN
ncbi:MAG: CPCC family cysteine-rich protein [Xenococcaceae cyanobacterium MO_167.B27]|nr:CPCC family cysteine-rich protein [Xenococcaceae cyanobacterium MO_167.B27]